MANPPTLSSAIGRSGPVFLRKLGRKTHWGSPETPLDERLADTVNLVFPFDQKPYSLFRVETDEEFRRVVIGMNGGRQSLIIDSSFIYIYPDELEALGLGPHQTPGITRCLFANSLHFEFLADEHQARSICRRLMEQNRGAIHLTRGMIRPWANEARALGCLADPNSNGCQVARCAPGLVSPPPDEMTEDEAD